MNKNFIEVTGQKKPKSYTLYWLVGLLAVGLTISKTKPSDQTVKQIIFGCFFLFGLVVIVTSNFKYYKEYREYLKKSAKREVLYVFLKMNLLLLLIVSPMLASPLWYHLNLPFEIGLLLGGTSFVLAKISDYFVQKRSKNP